MPSMARQLSQAVILAGGKGIRLMPLTKDRPKPMVEIHGKPFLEYLIDLLKESGITRVLILTGLMDDEFLLLYCDNYWPLKLQKLQAFHRTHGSTATMVVYSNKDKYSKNNVHVGQDDIIELYDKSRTAETLNGIDVGFFLLKKSALNLLPPGNPSFEAEVIPRLVERKHLAGFLKIGR